MFMEIPPLNLSKLLFLLCVSPQDSKFCASLLIIVAPLCWTIGCLETPLSLLTDRHLDLDHCLPLKLHPICLNAVLSLRFVWHFPFLGLRG